MNVAPIIDPVATVVICADTSNIDTVFVAGRILKHNGQLVRVDMPRLLQRLNDARDHLLSNCRRHPEVDFVEEGLTVLADTTDWRSDASIAYAILRLTLGVNIGLRGIVRIAHGGAVFADGIVKQMQPTVLPPSLVYAFAVTLIWVESAVGLMLIAGFQTRLALIVGGLMMAVLTFGTMQIENFQNAWLQLTYALVIFVVLVCRKWNLISLDALLGSRDRS